MVSSSAASWTSARALASRARSSAGANSLSPTEVWSSNSTASRNRHDSASLGTSASACADRKSTRLNSSHITISYAVFCLKKKKKTWDVARRRQEQISGLLALTVLQPHLRLVDSQLGLTERLLFFF